MSNNERIQIESTDEQNNQVNEASDKRVSRLGHAIKELEPRITPLVVIAIIAILISLLLPAVQSVRQ